MGLFLDAANAWNAMHDVNYVLEVAKKGVLTRIELSFLDEDFPHLVGMQYADDVDFGIRSAEYYGARLVPALLSKRMDDCKIESSRNWNRISGRLTAIINLENTLDNDFIIVAFNNKKVRVFSRLDAKFAIKSVITDDTYFVFLDERSGSYYCKSAFRKENVDYIANQSTMALLKKTKIVNDIPNVLFTKEGYIPN